MTETNQSDTLPPALETDRRTFLQTAAVGTAAMLGMPWHGLAMATENAAAGAPDGAGDWSRRLVNHYRAGGWLPREQERLEQWIIELRQRVLREPRPLVPPIQEFKEMVALDSVLSGNIEAMFKEALLYRQTSPLGNPAVKDFDEFLRLLNHIMTEAPEFTLCPDAPDTKEACATRPADAPCGLIGFPINALLDWPMATSFGYTVFSNALVNQQLKKILAYWSQHLTSEASRSVLVENHPERTPPVIAWLSPAARKAIVAVVCQASDDQASCCEKGFEDVFVSDPSDPYYGFSSWDDFFTRRFVDGLRPVATGANEIANACESAPLQVVEDVAESDRFWLKGQPYSLVNMMGFDPLASQFAGGTVYQAFLSALSYHRWNSPVDGVVRRAYVVDGSYYLENRYAGFIDPASADPSAPNDSQAFLTAVATRAVIFIEADDPKVGLMCFIAVGMAEVSSCEIRVHAGKRLARGDELGMFHFGGSTHCLIFRPGVKLQFHFDRYHTKPGLDATNVPVGAAVATVVG
jgi:phosphatidylserine decarboxylase